MRVLILGGSGMLGHKLCQVLGEDFEAWTTLRSKKDSFNRYGLVPRERVIDGVDVFNLESVESAMELANPSVAINAIGIIKQLPVANDAVTSIYVNSLFPHLLADICRRRGTRLIHISTDCVFSGRQGMYREADFPDAEDLYGRTKLLGEVASVGCLTLRTSIIGRELSGAYGLVEWFLSNEGGRVKGFTEAIYTGFPTLELAGIVAGLIENWQALEGLYQVSSDPINKYDLLSLLRDEYRLNIEIEPDSNVKIDRSLDSSKFRAATGFKPRPWIDMIRHMADDPTPYSDWRVKIVT